MTDNLYSVNCYFKFLYGSKLIIKDYSSYDLFHFKQEDKKYISTYRLYKVFYSIDRYDDCLFNKHFNMFIEKVSISKNILCIFDFKMLYSLSMTFDNIDQLTANLIDNKHPIKDVRRIKQYIYYDIII